MYAKFFQLFLIMALGFFLNRIRFITKPAFPSLNKLVNFVLFPCVIFANISALELTGETLLHFFEMLLIGALFTFVTILLLRLFLKKRRYPVPEEAADYLIPSTEVCGTLANSGFLGFPIALLFFGAEGLFFMIALNVVTNAFLFSYADLQFTPARERAGISKLSVLKHVALHPIFISMLLGVLVAAVRIPLPAMFLDTVSSIGGICSPLAMIYIGAILGDSDIHLRSYELRPLIASTVFKLLVAPLLALGFAALLLRSGLWTQPMAGTFVLAGALPAMAFSIVFAEMHHLNVRMCGWIVLVTTLLSIGTLPLWNEFLARIL